MLELTGCTDRPIEQEDNLVCAEARGAEKQLICTTIASENSLRCFRSLDLISKAVILFERVWYAYTQNLTSLVNDKTVSQINGRGGVQVRAVRFKKEMPVGV